MKEVIKMTKNQIQLEATQKRIEKHNNTLTRLQRLINNKTQKLENEDNKATDKYAIWKKEEYRDAIQEYQEDTQYIQEQLNKELEKEKELQEEIRQQEEKSIQIPKIEAVEQFLEEWGILATDFYKKAIEKYVTDKKEIQNNKDMSVYRTLINELKRKTNGIVMDIADNTYHKDWNKKIKSIIEREKDRKRTDLYTRTENKIGIITDASKLYIGDNLSLNGIITGEKGTCKVETIYAGGYNIQTLHYRVLIK
jgi:hypothetical protein